MMRRLIITTLTLTSVLLSSVSLQGCGTLFKQDQINQPRSSQPDYKIVLLDGVGLVLFIIPGVIAYAVDYANGTLFLPATTQTGKSRDEHPATGESKKHD